MNKEGTESDESTEFVLIEAHSSRNESSQLSFIKEQSIVRYLKALGLKMKTDPTD